MSTWDIYERLNELSVDLRKPSISAEKMFVSMVEFGDKYVYTSGHGCGENGVIRYLGKVGAEVSLEEGVWSARQCVINILSSLHDQLGDLNRINSVIKVLGFVASEKEFSKQTQIINGASQLLIDIFGEKNGKSARSAIGVNVLPNNQPVEIEIIFELK